LYGILGQLKVIRVGPPGARARFGTARPKRRARAAETGAGAGSNAGSTSDVPEVDDM